MLNGKISDSSFQKYEDPCPEEIYKNEEIIDAFFGVSQEQNMVKMITIVKQCEKIKKIFQELTYITEDECSTETILTEDNCIYINKPITTKTKKLVRHGKREVLTLNDPENGIHIIEKENYFFGKREGEQLYLEKKGGIVVKSLFEDGCLKSLEVY